ncbi:MAG TPA: AtpZ/AtpI family protein [Candidatus Dormibacteraeota bacterium]|nr:AtpZ/AtpI family protein [Candidatus Dormibacteraeota bacterium]
MPLLDPKMLAKSGRFLALGFQIAGSIIGSMLLGWFTDRHFGTEPMFTALFTLAGFYGSMRLLLWAIKKPSSDRIS